ncbi:MAG: hypothetical protein JOZ54_07675, partial [Acidobacteria bacterium]|nr:hypothetical protein [Acidobacteriota bacterium]
RLNHEWHAPRLEAVSFYVDQFPTNDMAREQAEEHGIRIFPSVAEAMRLGGSKIAVDAVAIVGEHGSYPRTARGNFMYPRWRYFDEATRVMREDGRVVPMYQDKYFAYEWKDARVTYDRVREMHIPFMCGSTVPLSWQRPPLDLPRWTPLTDIAGTSYSDLEEHGYHGIEAIQSVAERRGRETGVERVRWVNGEELDAACSALLDAALARRINPVPPISGRVTREGFVIRYRDGLRATLVHMPQETRDYCVAASVKGRTEPVVTCFYIELYLHNHWSFMVRNFEDLVLTRREPNPIERTLLANGILLAGLESRRLNGKWVDTPELDISY